MNNFFSNFFNSYFKLLFNNADYFLAINLNNLLINKLIKLIVIKNKNTKKNIRLIVIVEKKTFIVGKKAAAANTRKI